MSEHIADVESLLNVIVVGYGHAGRVHAKAHRDLVTSCRLAGIVERNEAYHSIIEQQMPGVDIFKSLDTALSKIKNNVLIDLCVPAPQNVSLANVISTYDVRRVMIEKPIGWSAAKAMTVADILHDCEAVYLDTYRSSLGVEQLQNWIVREQCEIDSIRIKFNKNRVTESMRGRGFDDEISPDAWHIEGPHMVTIATKLAGDILTIEEASLHNMKHNGSVLKNHGCAKAKVKHSSGVYTTLETDLCSDDNVRTVEVFLKNDVSLKLMLPVSKSTHLVSCIEKVVDGRVVDSFITEDRPMEQCIRHSIDYFLTGNKQVQMIEHGININQILQKLTEKSAPRISVDSSYEQLDIHGIC